MSALVRLKTVTFNTFQLPIFVNVVNSDLSLCQF